LNIVDIDIPSFQQGTGREVFLLDYLIKPVRGFLAHIVALRKDTLYRIPQNSKVLEVIEGKGLMHPKTRMTSYQADPAEVIGPHVPGLFPEIGIAFGPQDLIPPVQPKQDDTHGRARSLGHVHIE
jgi:hypothetical protein